MVYGAGMIKWTKEELRKIDRRTRKLMNMHRALHSGADVDRLYMKRAEGGWGMISVEDCGKWKRIVFPIAWRTETKDY